MGVKYEGDYIKEVAGTILSQLKVYQTELWAWGANNFLYREREVDGAIFPALMFSVRTPKIKSGGRVIISYNVGTDEYIVEAIKVIKDKETSLGIQHGVYCDSLHSVINSLIEDKKTYTQVLF